MCKWLKKRNPFFQAAIMVSLLWGIFLALDFIGLPSKIFSKIGLSHFFKFIEIHLQKWGDLMTFIVGIVIGIILPDIIKKKTFKNTEDLKAQSQELKAQSQELKAYSKELKDHTVEIIDYIRGNLTTFDAVYSKVCSILKEIQEDKDSCFIVASQMPVLGSEKYSHEDNIYLQNIYSRMISGKKTRIISLNPYNEKTNQFDNTDSDVAIFCNYLSKFEGKRSGFEIYQDVQNIFCDFKKYRKNLDVIVLENIPYQIFLSKDKENKRKCVFLLSSKDAIKYKLPSGGFCSEETNFIDLIEKSLKALLGNNRSLYELQHSHSQKIEDKWRIYANDFKGIKAKEVENHLAILKNIEMPESELLKNNKLTIYPYVFNPKEAESERVMLLAIMNNINTSTELVIDVGCGSGSLTIAALNAGAKRVIALDINEYAVRCTKRNCELAGQKNKVDVHESNLFSKLKRLKPKIQSDVIIADLPFVNKHVEKDDLIGISLYDFMLNLNKKFIEEAHNYLKDSGKIIISFSNLDSLSKFIEIIESHGWEFSISKPSIENDYEWYYFVLTKK